MIFKYVQETVADKTLLSERKNVQKVLHNKKELGVGTSTWDTDAPFFAVLNINQNDYKMERTDDGIIPIYRNNKIVGRIISEHFVETGKFLCFNTGYKYWEVEFDGRKLSVFTTGDNSKHGLHYQVMENDQTIAIIQKLHRAKEYLHEYNCYIKDEKMVDFCSVWCLFKQSTEYYHYMPLMSSGEHIARIHKTKLSKAEIALFDYDFKKDIIDNYNY